jgi:hypothetical protein
MEIMAHVNKRVKGHTAMKLPLIDLAQLTHDGGSQDFEGGIAQHTCAVQSCVRI